MSIAALSTRRRCKMFLRGLMMNRFRVTIRSAMALVFFAGVGLAALRDPSVWWVGGVVACLIGLLLTACVGAMYSTGRERAFWLGIVVFGGGYLLLSRVLSTDATGNPVAFTDRALDTPALDLRSAPAAGAKVLAELHGNGNFRQASVLQFDRTNGCYFVHYQGRTDDDNAWLIPAQIKLQNGNDYHAVGNLLVVILFAMIGSVVSVAFYDSRERRRGERPSPALAANRE
jgi:hypothetical protein